MRHVAFFMICLLFAVISSASLAQAADVGNAGIEEGTINGISYASGGIGLDERAQMEKMEKKYNVKMSFALLSKPYLSDVSAVIKNRDGKVLFDKVSIGPWLFVKLPEGDYAVTASYKGQKETKQVKVGKKLEALIFDWKSE